MVSYPNKLVAWGLLMRLIRLALQQANPNMSMGEAEDMAAAITDALTSTENIRNARSYLNVLIEVSEPRQD